MKTAQIYHPAAQATLSAYNYPYNGKAIQWKPDPDWYDYGARFYDPQIGRWHVPDPLAEYAYNNSLYNYVKNNPLLYIDLFGLSDTTYIAPDPIEVVVTYTPPPKSSSLSGFRQFLNAIDPFLMGNYNPRKVHAATKFDEWKIRNFDQSEVKRIGDIFGKTGVQEMLNNYVTTTESYQGRTEDKEIKKKSTGKGEETDGSGRSIIRYSRETGDSIPNTVKKSWLNKNGKFIHYNKDGKMNEAQLGDTLSWEKVKERGYIIK